jgi:hypothetical protein
MPLAAPVMQATLPSTLPGIGEVVEAFNHLVLPDVAALP